MLKVRNKGMRNYIPRRRQTSWITKWQVFGPTPKGLDRTLGAKVQTIGMGIRIEAEDMIEMENGERIMDIATTTQIYRAIPRPPPPFPQRMKKKTKDGMFQIAGAQV